MKASVIIIACFVPLICILEQGGNSMAETQANTEFKIYVLADRLIDVMPYDYENAAWSKLLETPPQGTIILTDKDIEFYDWGDQEIVLSAPASERLGGRKFIEKSFVACLGGKPLFGGSFIERGSARAINYPVIYIDRSRPQVVFQIRPLHTGFVSYRELDTKTKKRIELPDVRSYFSTLGKLR